MRPIVKGLQGAYAPVIDISTQATLNTSLAAYVIDFKSVAAQPISKVWGVSNPPASDVLGGLLDLAKYNLAKSPKKKAKKTGPTIDDIEKVKPTVINKLAKIYGRAAGPLELNLGRFCSFCEFFYQSGLGVEHIAPKSEFPLFYIAWDNFLLSCPVCNSIKLDRPPRDDALFGKPLPKTEVAYFGQLKDSYLWPQWYDKVYRETKPQLEYLDAKNAWQPVTYPVEAGTVITNRDQTDRSLFGTVSTDVDVKTGKTTTKVKQTLTNVQLRVTVTTIGAKSKQMVENLVKLNRPSNNNKDRPGGEADIRVYSRTEHWFKVLETLLDLKTATTQNEFDRTWRGMMRSMQQPGQYSVWVTVIDLLGPNRAWSLPDGTTTVMDKFLTAVLTPEYFPGTNIANTP